MTILKFSNMSLVACLLQLNGASFAAGLQLQHTLTRAKGQTSQQGVVSVASSGDDDAEMAEINADTVPTPAVVRPWSEVKSVDDLEVGVTYSDIQLEKYDHPKGPGMLERINAQFSQGPITGRFELGTDPNAIVDFRFIREDNTLQNGNPTQPYKRDLAMASRVHTIKLKIGGEMFQPYDQMNNTIWKLADNGNNIRQISMDQWYAEKNAELNRWREQVLTAQVTG